MEARPASRSGGGFSESARNGPVGGDSLSLECVKGKGTEASNGVCVRIKQKEGITEFGGGGKTCGTEKHFVQKILLQDREPNFLRIIYEH